MSKEADKIEKEIQQLIKVRSKIFNEWAQIVKQNERNADMLGVRSSSLEARAEKLLKDHDDIRAKILTLIQQVDSLSSI